MVGACSLLILAGTFGSMAIRAEVPGDALPATHATKDNAAQNRSASLRLVSLNMAHGRKDGISQLLQSEARIHGNLQRISELLTRIDADIVALQEADGPSRWSGNFDHVEWLARQAEYPWQARVGHAESWLFSYGTAILSRWPVAENYGHTFSPSPPTFNKGFQLVHVDWPSGGNNRESQGVDIVSVHLDFSRRSVRRKQIDELSEVLSQRTSPTVVLGDFNSDWLAENGALRQLADRLDMRVYQPDSEQLVTYPANGKRIDWILISRDLEFLGYRVWPDVVSDHLAVVADIGRSADAQRVSQSDE